MSTRPYLLFEQIVKGLLGQSGYQLTENPEIRIDAIAWKDSQQWVIEIKFYRTARAQTALLEAAAATVLSAARQLGAVGGMLVVSSIVPSQAKQVFEKRFGILLFDRDDVRTWAAGDPAVADRLEALLETPPDGRPQEAKGRDSSAEPRLGSATTLLQANDAGEMLCADLRKIPKGKKGWRLFEQHSEKILRYLFPDDLHGWHKQKRTDDGLNRFDYVCRIRPTREFWKFLIDHLQSRYVLFEFKNYTGKVKQGQILTTEKYLLERGLRRVAFVLTRKGADVSAIRMAQGAMREHGKLMILLSDDHVCQLLLRKQGGDDPTDLLFDWVDDFLLSLPR